MIYSAANIPPNERCGMVLMIMKMKSSYKLFNKIQFECNQNQTSTILGYQLFFFSYVGFLFLLMFNSAWS